ncbi:class I SAM-dependent methyltransferase [Gordonia hydrophobica]|uniref:Class I SAM-dependent methyltransferase n=1 Tax=Gordonia hydrophobica TaxID=40516 RepID=A0ABZ2U8S9_9ACTN|nr:class I SAM-dependent methyltransferase [Gordonia hydrophobica]MBM7368637.1 SAM-dependent methyltransferase [Gordonia hydrophobica]
MNFDALLISWDRQQEAYIANREFRFTAILDALEVGIDTDSPTIVDLACGPGSLSNRILDRFTNSTVIGIDFDRALLELARRTSPHNGDRLRLLEADLADTSWIEKVNSLGFDNVQAVVSTTALHWLQPDELLRLYGRAYDILDPNGILLNGDHFRFGPRTPLIEGWSRRHDQRTQQNGFDNGVLSWQEWWEELGAAPGMKDLVALRNHITTGDSGAPDTTVEFQIAALAQSGFSESGTLWQFFDDFVVYGVK